MDHLEIRVGDSVLVTDNFGESAYEEAVAFVTLELKKKLRSWFDSDRQCPLEVPVKAIGGQGPPVLGINVGDTIKIHEVLH